MTVKVYSTPSCVYCRMAKQYFDSLNVAYEDVDVSVNEAAAREMIEKTQQMGVPVIEIGNKVIIGFNKTAIDEALAAQKNS